MESGGESEEESGVECAASSSCVLCIVSCLTRVIYANYISSVCTKVHSSYQVACVGLSVLFRRIGPGSLESRSGLIEFEVG